MKSSQNGICNYPTKEAHIHSFTHFAVNQEMHAKPPPQRAHFYNFPALYTYEQWETLTYFRSTTFSSAESEKLSQTGINYRGHQIIVHIFI